MKPNRSQPVDPSVETEREDGERAVGTVRFWVGEGHAPIVVGEDRRQRSVLPARLGKKEERRRGGRGRGVDGGGGGGGEEEENGYM